LYGIGVPFINAFSLFIFGHNVFSIFLITNIFYFLSIFFILLIFLKFKFSFLDNLFFILILINIHPATELPWSSYLSFFPIVLSLYFILKKNKKNYFLSGLCLALACLIRETVLLSAGIIFLYVIIESYFFKKKNFSELKFYILGFFIPLTIFIVYMIISSNYLIWIELVYPIYQWQSLIDIGYYIKTDLSPLRKFYIFFLAPYRQLFLVFLESIRHFWFNWLLIYISYLFCLLFLFKRVVKKDKLWNEDALIKYRIAVIAIYSLSLIIQNIHIVVISRVAVGSILGLIILFYLFKKKIQSIKIRFIVYTVAFILLLFFSHGVYLEQKKIDEGKLDKLYSLIFQNIKKNYNILFANEQKKILDKKFFIKEFKNMNYEPTTHKFYANVREVCRELRFKKEIKYSDNQTFFWELPYFCETKPKHYYALTLTSFIEENFKKSAISKKFESNNSNTIGFYVSNDVILKESTYFDINGFTKKRKIKNFQILYFADLKKNYPELFKYYRVRYFFIIQNI
jgi:hypothetical protein